jgi:hypothetical protein
VTSLDFLEVVETLTDLTPCRPRRGVFLLGGLIAKGPLRWGAPLFARRAIPLRGCASSSAILPAMATFYRVVRVPPSVIPGKGWTLEREPPFGDPREAPQFHLRGDADKEAARLNGLED